MADTTAPKPFVFVLMPFDAAFSDVYKFGIRGAAEDVGAYAERLDEQMFTEGMLDRIFNQISKADVVVADMTGRNPNVFYEVGYAHALNKVVLLLTQQADDIPFDLKHRAHIVYGGQIGTLREELRKRLSWAIEESRARSRQASVTFALKVTLLGAILHEVSAGVAQPDLTVDLVPGAANHFTLNLYIRNDGTGSSEPISYVYILGEVDPTMLPVTLVKHTSSAPDLMYGRPAGQSSGRAYTTYRTRPLTTVPASEVDLARLGLARQYRLDQTLPALPPGAVDVLRITFSRASKGPWRSNFCLRFHTTLGQQDYPFSLAVHQADKPADG